MYGYFHPVFTRSRRPSRTKLYSVLIMKVPTMREAECLAETGDEGGNEKEKKPAGVH